MSNVRSTRPLTKYEGSVHDLREAEKDVVIASPRTATPARLQIHSPDHMELLKHAQENGLAVQALADPRSGVIAALRLPPPPKN